MNSVELTGRLVRDPEQKQNATSFTIAVDRPVRDGSDKKADFIRIVTFSKLAETCGRFLMKGRMVAVQGRIQTGSYTNKNGDTVYTTDVIAMNVDFMDAPKQKQPDFEQIDEPVPF